MHISPLIGVELSRNTSGFSMVIADFMKYPQSDQFPIDWFLIDIHLIP